MERAAKFANRRTNPIFYDIQWTKKTSDGLMWLVRSFHEGDDRTLQLLGRLDGTEWGLDDL